jgi:hypothetical protein
VRHPGKIQNAPCPTHLKERVDVVAEELVEAVERPLDGLAHRRDRVPDLQVSERRFQVAKHHLVTGLCPQGLQCPLSGVCGAREGR